jgi:hypothetical protein
MKKKTGAELLAESISRLFVKVADNERNAFLRELAGRPKGEGFSQLSTERPTGHYRNSRTVLSGEPKIYVESRRAEDNERLLRHISACIPGVGKARISCKSVNAAKAFYDMNFDSAMDAINDWIGWKNYKPSSPPVIEDFDQYFKILAINDLHVPYHDEDRFRWVLENYKGKIDICVVVGDFADMYNYSRYPKRQQRFTALQEMVGISATLVQLAEAFPEIILMTGNHDERFKKHLISCGIQGDELEAMSYLSENALNPVAALVKKNGLTNIKLIDPIKNGYAEWDWIWQRGDLVLGHPEKFSKIPNKVATEFAGYLMRYKRQLGLNDFTVVGAGHTHQAGKVWSDFGIVAMELGCLAMTPEYASDPRMPGARPAVKGYSLFLQDRETKKTNINLSNFYELV